MSKLSLRAENLLREILEHRDSRGKCDTDYWKGRFEGLTVEEDALLRSLFKELREMDMISTSWGDNYPFTLILLANGLSYFEEKDPEEHNGSTYINHFYGPANGIQIQQGSLNSMQYSSTESLDSDSILKLIATIKRYDPLLDAEYGSKAAKEVRESIEELSTIKNNHSGSSRARKILEYLRDLSVNAGGSLIATGILQLINTILR